MELNRTAAWISAYPRYADYDPAVPVHCVTPQVGRTIHRFFDTSALSPSGSYMALTRFPFEDRSPRAGDEAEIVLVDLEQQTERVIDSTKAWGSQLGAQVQWGVADEQLYYNTLADDWRPVGIRYNLSKGAAMALAGPVYHVNSDGRWAVSPCLLRTGRTQLGYGVMAPDKYVPQNTGAPGNDGVIITALDMMESRVLVSLEDIVAQLPYLQQARFADGDFYAFHTKWSPDDQRIMVIVRWTPRPRKRWWGKAKPASKKTMRKFVITVNAEGRDARIAISDDQWARGGHHPNWHPDSQSVTMNLDVDGSGIKFARAPISGGEVELLHPTAAGSGHPSVHPGGRFLLTDAYPGEAMGYGDGTVPIRLLDLQEGTEQVIARIQSRPAYVGDRKEMRVDAHPAWDRSGNFVIFNGCADGTRRVYVADVSALVNR